MLTRKQKVKVIYEMLEPELAPCSSKKEVCGKINSALDLTEYLERKEKEPGDGNRTGSGNY